LRAANTPAAADSEAADSCRVRFVERDMSESCCAGVGGNGIGIPCAMSSSVKGAGSIGEVSISPADCMRNEGVEYWILRPS
jgi:hypothetical protein